MKKLELVRAFEDVTVESNIDLTVEMNKREVEKDVYEYEFFLNWDAEQAKEDGSKVAMHWFLPLVDVQYMWHPATRPRRVLDGNWRLKIESKLTYSAPIGVLFNSADMNTYTFATDEVKKETSVTCGTYDHEDAMHAEISMGLKQFVNQNSDRLLVRADFRKIPYYEVIDDVRKWWEDVLDLEPMPVPDVARMPVYSSWYNFHQDIKDTELEAECVRAKELGMDAIIVDDGWQCENNGGGYGYTGDWEPYEGKIANMKEDVKRVHEAGLKYILWYSVPYVGYFSKNWERFKDKVIYTVDRSNAGVLDPRYPEVRQFLIDTYVNAMKEFDLDGFKLDFVDRFKLLGDAEMKPGMDFACVQEATDRMMTDIMLNLKAIKEDIMIEFRQSYIGPAMRRFGNMFRVGDCASDIASNRIGTIDLRLTSGNTSVHADMLTWNNAETTEDAALQILNVMFGVIQFSKIIEELTPDHREMVAFWLKFARENEKVLQESKLIPYEPHFLYPVVKAYDEKEEIIAVYAMNKILHPDLAKEKIQVINASKEAAVYLKVEQDTEAKILTRDCKGHVTNEETVSWKKGVVQVSVPRSGLLEITK